MNGPVDRPGGFALTERGLALCTFPLGARLLDVGCGTGATVRLLRQRHSCEAAGLDADLDRVRGREHLVCGRAERLPWREASLDGVLMECSLSVLEDPDQALAEARRVLRSGGGLLVSDIYARGAGARLGGCLGRVETRQEIVARFETARFQVERFEDCTPHLRALWGQRILERGRAALCAELGADPERLRHIDCGYALLVARKAAP